MSDIKLAYKSIGDELGFFDIDQSGAGLLMDEGLESAVIVSLFTDRRAEDDDELPGNTDDRRGWWGDNQSVVDNDRIGSRLWLLSREKQTAAVLSRAREYAAEALQWLIDDGVASEVNVSAEYVRRGVLGLGIEIVKPDKSTLEYRFEHLWDNG